MNVFGLLMGVMLAVAGIVGGIYTLRGGADKDERAAWHDNSLDEWRKARDAAAEAERQARLASPPQDAGRDEPHERIGG
jgi:hypothetical protein